jgi:type IV pilus assembly protein PilW
MKQTQIRVQAVALGRQHGFNLVELMVAIAVAVFLLIGLFSILQNTRHTNSDQTALAQLQDNERFAMSIITEMVESAGYYTGAPTNTPETQLPVDGATFPTAGQAISGGGNNAQGDVLVARFQTALSDGVQSCMGRSNTSNPTQIFKNTFLVNTSNQLICSDANGVTGVALVNNIVSMNIRWGVNSSSTQANSYCPADTYYTSATIPAFPSLAWSNVCTVEVTLVFVNPMYQPIPGGPITPGQPATVRFVKVISVMSKAGNNTVTLT